MRDEEKDINAALHPYGSSVDSNRGRLFLCPQPKQGESWPGYLVRVANANCLPSLSTLANFANLRRVRDLLQSDPREILPRLGIGTNTESTWAPHTSYQSLVNRSGHKGLLHQRWTSPVCPCCLAEDGDQPHIRSHWDWAMQAHCPIHKVLLVECCSHCNQLIDLRRPSVDICACGADLKREPTQCSDMATSAIFRLLPELDIDRTGQTFERELLIHREAVRVVQWLALPPKTNGKRSKRFSDQCLRLSRNGLCALDSLTLEWPRKILEVVKPKVSLDSLASRTALGVRLYKRSFGLWQFLIDELQRDSSTSTNSCARSKNAVAKHVLRSRHHVQALRSITGHGSGILKQQLLLGNFSFDIFKIGDLFDPHVLEIDEIALRKVQAFYASTLDLESAAKLVGASCNALRGLISTNCLLTESICRDPSFLTFRRIHSEELRQFTADLFERAQPWIQSDKQEAVKFSDWVTMHAHGRENRYKRWIDILQSIRAGKLPLYKTVTKPEELDELVLSPQDLTSVSDKRRMSHKCFC